MDRYRSSSRRSPPPRDRAPLRDRDNHPDVEYFGQGESYRPGGVGDGPYRPTPRERPADSWNGRDDRGRDDRRRDDRREDIDSYIPPTSTRAARPRSRSPPPFRRRSRSPFGRREELFPDRTRSPPAPPPPPRRYSPRRDERPRSPIRRRSRTPPYARPRSPDIKRPREYSPDGRRSPKRERLNSPRGRFDRPRSPPRRPFSPPRENNYRPRSRTPPRGGRSAYTDDNWRRRSPSARPSGLNSNNTSRRSSPPVHQERANVPAPAPVPRSPAYPPRGYDNQEQLSYRTRSPRRDYPEKSRDPSPPLERDGPTVPPTGPAGYRNGGQDRPPPTGPSRPYNPPPQASPPTGPASQVSMSAHNRSGPPPTAPSRPRGGGRFDAPSWDFATPSIRGRGNLSYRAPGVRSTSFNETAPPSGPRTTTFNGPPRGDYGGRGDISSRGGFAGAGGGYGRGDHSSYSATFRGSTNSSSTTYPRTQRFNVVTPTSTAQTHLATLEKIVPGGKKLPSGIPTEQERRMRSLEIEAEKMREAIKEKQKLKREALTEWEVRERESEREALRSELAAGALNKLLEGDEGMSGAAF